MRELMRRYPPLAVIIAALLLAVFALPSALNLPQANPGQTVEYAPVPGDNGQAPPGGNLAGLSLGSGSDANGGLGTSGSGPGTGPPPPPPPSQAPVASVKQCIGTPPRQTEDPLSPPCVASFNGDNGGATYKGVTGNEVRVLFYSDVFQYNGCNTNTPTPGSYYDLALPPDPSENTCLSPILRTWQREFNTRYQTYNRRVHFFLYFSPATTAPVTPEQRRADAQDNINHVRPFAIIPLVNFLAGGNVDAYDTAVLGAGVLVFTKQPFEPSSLFSTYAPLLWGFPPSLEEQAKTFTSYVCTKVLNQPTSFGGGTVAPGQARTYGLIKTTDSSNALLQKFQDYVAQGVQACGVKFDATASYPVDGYAAYASSNPTYTSYGPQDMAVFKQKNITTVIWPGGYETNFSHAAAKLGYLPEWVVAGDGENESWGGGNYQDPTAWAHAVAVTPVARITSLGVPQACAQAFQEADPNPTDYNNWIGYACYSYPDIRQLFNAIQVAGPHLTPAAVDQGYHAIPPYMSHDPEQPACYYEPGDYTCIKDAQAVYWDNTGTTGGNPGCYRMMQGGARYTAGHWPSGNVTKQENPSDPCNQYFGGALFGTDARIPGQ